MAEVVKTIRSSGGDYTSLSAWESAQQQDLVTAGDIAVAECYDDWAGGLSDDFTIAGWTTDSSNYVIVRCAAGEEHDGTPANGFWISGWGFGACLIVQQQYTQLQDLHVINNRSTADAIDLSGDNAKAIRCIAKGGDDGIGLDNNGTRAIACLAYDCGGEGFGFNRFVTGHAYNCTSVDNDIGFNNGSGGSNNALKNCVAYNNTTNNYSTGSWASASVDNAASDAATNTPPGTSPLTTNIVSGDFLDSANDDWHIDTDSNLYEEGTDLSGDFTYDIDNDTWAATWSIGMDQPEVAAGGQYFLPATSPTVRMARGWPARNKKPHIPVVVDRAHRLGDVWLAAIWNQHNPGSVFMRDGRRLTSPALTYSGDYIKRASANTEYSGASNFPSTDFTIAWRGEAVSNEYIAEFNTYDPGFRYQTGGSDDYAYWDGNPSFGGNIEGQDFLGIPIRTHVIRGTWDGSTTTTMQAWIEGRKGNLAPTVSEHVSGKTFYLLGGFQRSATNDHEFCYLWDRALSDAEVAAFFKDQYGFLKPTTDSPFLLGVEAAAPGEITGDLSAQETGSDTAALVGDVLVAGTLAVSEAGSDTIALTGEVRVAGTLTAQETGADVLAMTGNATGEVNGDLAAVETGADTAALTGGVEISGTISASETGLDVTVLNGAVHVSGTLTAQETGADTIALNGSAPAEVSGTLAAVEAGSDTAAILGGLQVTGTISVSETGDDAAALVGALEVAGSLAAVETGLDTALFTERDFTSGDLAAVESAADAINLAGLITRDWDLYEKNTLDVVYSVHGKPAIYNPPAADAIVCKMVEDTDAQNLPDGADPGLRGSDRRLRVRASEVTTPTVTASITFKGEALTVDGYEPINEWEWQLNVRAET